MVAFKSKTWWSMVMLLIARVQRRHHVYQNLCFTRTCCGGLGRFGALRRFGALTRFGALRRFNASTRYSSARDLHIHQVKCRRSEPLWRFFACGALKLWRLETLWRCGAIWRFDALALRRFLRTVPIPLSPCNVLLTPETTKESDQAAHITLILSEAHWWVCQNCYSNCFS